MATWVQGCIWYHPSHHYTHTYPPFFLQATKKLLTHLTLFQMSTHTPSHTYTMRRVASHCKQETHPQSVFPCLSQAVAMTMRWSTHSLLMRWSAHSLLRAWPQSQSRDQGTATRLRWSQPDRLPPLEGVMAQDTPTLGEIVRVVYT